MSKLEAMKAELVRREQSQGKSHDVGKMNRLRREIAAKENRMSRPTLKWEFDGQGRWRARSAFQADGIVRDWEIVVCDDGTFDVNESAERLLPARKVGCFPNLREAKEWCVNREGNVLDDFHEPCEGCDVPDSGKDAVGEG